MVQAPYHFGKLLKVGGGVGQKKKKKVVGGVFAPRCRCRNFTTNIKHSFYKSRAAAAIMAKLDVSSQIRSLHGDTATFALLPSELQNISWWETSTEILDAVAEASLIDPRLTDRIFAHFEPVFPDIAARWILSSSTADGVRIARVIYAFARILPFAPHLSVFLEDFLRGRGVRIQDVAQDPTLVANPPNSPNILEQFPLPDLEAVLVSIWRLMSFDRKAYSQLVPARVETLFHHPRRPVRYLAIRIFCQLFSASDFTLETLIGQHVQDTESLEAWLDGETVDYLFLTLLEHARAKRVQTHLTSIREMGSLEAHSDSHFPHQRLTPAVVSWGRTLTPRPAAAVPITSSLVLIPTTVSNLEELATKLQKPGPILLHGLPGSGKTCLVQEAAAALGTSSDLVTLHLNEQTDAKMLIGLYTTDSKPGSFTWRPGILTTAVREGRWVLIEDLDRAPTEVMSTLLPLIERRELLIPNRGDTIRAPSSFRIFATVRTSLGMDGQENLPSFLGQRFWQLMSVRQLPQQELRQIIDGKFPILKRLSPSILDVFNGLSTLLRNPSSASISRGAVERPVNARDLFKWCRRLEQILTSAGSRTGEDKISDTTVDHMFMEAVDCFLGSLKSPAVKEVLAHKIGHEMRMPAERISHILKSHTPGLEESQAQLVAGRAVLSKSRRSGRVAKMKRPFASTVHARRLLEQIAVATQRREPILLVGETGIGKTTVVQQLADSLGHKLVAVNLSQQSEVGDLLGGFKPVNPGSLAIPLKEEFEDLFAATGISAERNQKYLSQISKCFAKAKWKEVCKLWKQAPKMFDEIIRTLQEKQNKRETNDAEGQPAKRRKTGTSKLDTLMGFKPRWEKFSESLDQFEIQVSGGSNGFAFAFSEGNIIKAVRNGDWVLLDEINLASPDTLESIADLLQSGPNDTPSILLSETGDIERIKAHPDFRIFAAMNPATDVGKKDLPIGLRSRFTELYVGSPDRDVKDLVVIIKTYLRGNNSTIDKACDKVANLYLTIKKLAEEKALVDGANEVPHFSLRTLTRVLTYVNDVAPVYGVYRSLFEGFCMGFLTLLDRKSESLVLPMIMERLSEKSPRPPKRPEDGKTYVKFVSKERDRQYWLLQGAEEPRERPDYIRTRYVERNLLNLVRATSTRRFPILIQGPTSAGKTSMIEYLANYSGNKFVRINNHEHTDLQEYLGTYVSGNDGKLRFQEGILVQAMRQGSWIVLDELNLAPTDVLEALNRLLDDNRELLIPETQEVVRPHENFVLFATQNPPGLYGGRKVLSRAFRNRFLELHFDDIPEDELEEIIQRRCRNTSPPDCRRIVSVYKELSRLRQTSRIFEQKDSFATLRDLFRWAFRAADNRDQVAQNGYMLLSERVRNEEERLAVKGVIESVFRVKIDPEIIYDQLFSLEMKKYGLVVNSQGVTWTRAMRRLFVLVSQALRNNEPVILVGETGCGKTTVCQLLAEAVAKELHIVNAHQNTETGDLLGSQRPVRNRGAIINALKDDVSEALKSVGLASDGAIEKLLQDYQTLSSDQVALIPKDIKARIAHNDARSKALFEWSDGSLVQAMKSGDFFLLDEISLADDSVLERLNSVLEPERTLLLAEKGVNTELIRASEGFQFFATMNPGGDFGKKELSPALRNRFTEIWVPPLSDKQDVLDIVSSKLSEEFASLATPIVEFSYWFGQTCRSSSATAISIREILVWVAFINRCHHQKPSFALIHGAATVFIDTLGANPSALVSVDPKSINEQRDMCLSKLGTLLGDNAGVASLYYNEPALQITPSSLCIGDFSIPRDAVHGSAAEANGFAFEARTTKLNAMRVIRALQINKPILLEGNPGVGKTTLVSAIAAACGRPLTRINLSDQTDLMDLFGTDVPVEGAEAGNFAWRDAPFLQAMQKGEWVLLDEMNLASQSVLEGLNACLDHRGEVYISELDQVFKRHPNFRLFAAQNPHQQGGGRKGLPSSFVNRFIVVYADVFTADDLLVIASKRAKGVSDEIVRQMIHMISTLDDHVVIQKSFGSHGSPWEFNLRDTLRWLDLLGTPDSALCASRPEDFFDIVIRQRFRTLSDRQAVTRLFCNSFDRDPEEHSLLHNSSSIMTHVGHGFLRRDTSSNPDVQHSPFSTTSRLSEIESLLICVKQNLPCILVGPSGSGKSALLQHVAGIAGKELVVFHLNADVDTMDLVGGFEQADPVREVLSTLAEIQHYLRSSLLLTSSEAISDSLELLRLLDAARSHNSLSLDFSPVIQAIQQLASKVSGDSDLGLLLERAFTQLNKPLRLENPRFEWIDGIIVKAAQAGHWLVLDNANLCSASVLDRLNSLLERPGGFLSINEHSGPNGEPRVIVPDPEFRVFLTMDPRYGELSRAMRNRSVEIFMDLPSPQVDSFLQYISNVEASMLRYHQVVQRLDFQPNPDQPQTVALLAADQLSLSDSTNLSRFYALLSAGRLSSVKLSPATNGYINFLLSYIRSQNSSSIASDLGTAVFNAYSTLRELIPMTATDPGAVRSLVEMQPIHPLQDSIVAALVESKSHGQLHWLAVCFETYESICTAEEAMDDQMRSINITKPSTLNRLQRSCISKRVAVVAKDSTVSISEFLSSVLEAVKEYISSSLNSPMGWQQKRNTLRLLLHYWWRTFDLATSQSFEEAIFQAHLLLGTKLMESLHSRVTSHDQSLVSKISRDFQSAFEFGFKLTTGVSMEVMWNVFRPVPIPHLQTFEQVMAMERLAQRFDSLKWQANASPDDLEHVISSLVKAYTLVRNSAPGTGALLEAVTAEIVSLESRTEGSVSAPPIFSSQFEALRKQLVLYNCLSAEYQPQSRSWLALCGLPTISRLRHQIPRGPARLLQSLDYLFCQDAEVHPWSGNTSSSVLRNVHSARLGTLSSLRSLETEMPLLGFALATTAEHVAANPVKQLNRMLRELLEQAIMAHGNHSQMELGSVFDKLENVEALALQPTDKWLSNQKARLASIFPRASTDAAEAIMANNFLASMAALAASSVSSQYLQSVGFSAIAWVQFAIGCLRLYVPDKAFDPHLRVKIERENHEQLLDSLQQKLTALTTFDNTLADGSPSLRTVQAKEELESIGDGPSRAPPIFRQTAQEQNQIQGEFNNVLNTIVNQDVPTSQLRALEEATQEAIEGIQLVKDNVAQLISRLAGRSVAYQDMTVPTINLLRALQVGLSLSDSCIAEGSNKTGNTFFSVTPLVGGTLWTPGTHNLQTKPLEFLSVAKAYASVEGLSIMSSEARQSVFESFHRLYEEWNKKLASERKTEEAKSSLYRFRGSFEDEEEHDQAEFDELFPDYEAPEETVAQPSRQPPHKVRDLSVRLAKLHRELFLSKLSPEDELRRICKEVALTAAKSNQIDVNLQVRDKMLLSSAILVVHEELKDLRSTGVTNTYNFYTDANLSEARRLIEVVHKTQLKFQELQRVDEIGHLQPLADVVNACSRVMELGYADPLAKMLPSLEKLHESLYEWQFRGYASRQYIPATLYDKVTETIVSWRRLELSTWARLFDSELQKCREDADSWYFVAYQAVIAGPLSLMEKGVDLRTHAPALLEELEQYFANSILGEFTTRLNMLKQFQAHLDLLALDYPQLAAIRDALRNFLTFYARFEIKATEAIQRGRASLEKTMKDVLLMASWKDTNVVALRESSRKSHLKLFRLVRKFRAVLGQPMRPIIVDQGLPEDAHLSLSDSFSHSTKSVSGLDMAKHGGETLQVCQQLESKLGKDSSAIRLSRAEQLVHKMAQMSTIPDSAVAAAELLDGFMSDTVSSIAEMRKETPGFLTEENKAQVKHLKTRKVKLFNDTLKSIRQMGFSYNLSQSRLARQASTPAVLACTQPLHRLGAGQGILEYQFDKFIGIAPKWRDAIHDHHGDLSRNVIQRSAGYLEGILLVALQQREVLGGESHELHNFEETVQQIVGLDSITANNSSQKDICVVVSHQSTEDYLERSLRWLIEVLRLAMQVVDAHATLGKVDNKPATEALKSWVSRLLTLQERLEVQPSLPTGLSSAVAQDTRQQIREAFSEAEQDMSRLSKQRPDLAFVLDQVPLWTDVQATQPPRRQKPTSLTSSETVYREVLTTVQKVLSALQNLSKNLATLPISVDDASWLVEYSTGLSTALKSLHIGTIDKDLSRCLTKLSCVRLDERQENRAAISLFLTSLPIFQQYAAISRSIMDTLAHLHHSTCKVGHQLGKSFLDIASHGFCMPQEKSDETSGDKGKMEGGTGLGDGEGAENISKDIGEDEDLSELAQEPNQQQNNEDMDDEEDAIDMGTDEMEGDLASVGGGDDEQDGERSGDEDGDEDEMDEQAGDVDDLDPTAVDEKMWNDDGEEADKDQRGDAASGKQQKDEEVGATDSTAKQAAEQQQGEEPAEAEEAGEEAGPQEEEAKPQEELNRQDQNVQESEALALPDEMELDRDDDDGDGDDDDGDDLDDLPELENDQAEPQGMETDSDNDYGDDKDDITEAPKEAEGIEDEIASEDEMGIDDEDIGRGEDQMDEDPKDEAETDDPDAAKEKESGTDQNQARDNNADPENAASSDVKSGGGQDQHDNQQDNSEETQENAGQRDQGDITDPGAEQNTSAASQGRASGREEAPQPDAEQGADSAEQETLPFKKLGDLLEKWYRNNKDIREATKDQDEADTKRQAQEPRDQAATDEFQHLQDETAPADTQALGAATDEEAKPIDDTMAIDEEAEADKYKPQLMPDQMEDEEDDKVMQDSAQEDADEAAGDDNANAEDGIGKNNKNDRDQGRSGVATHQGAYHRDNTASPEPGPVEQAQDAADGETEEEDEMVQETSTQLSATHLVDEEAEQSTLRDLAECVESWSKFQTRTHGLSLSLASQLRLILTPSQATKLSGSHRTGKRLNIKKIIPYIASGYKRDKIWMRRSVPTKRTYQILLCVDDSLSMGNNGMTSSQAVAPGGAVASKDADVEGPGALALESLVMVSRALNMLEVGQVGVLGFGSSVFVAHELAEPFSTLDAGARVLQNFCFRQDGTDVALLMRRIIDHFTTARLQSSSSGQQDLWQLALVMSDGLTPSSTHDRIRRLLREAMEERIMVVFIVMDDPIATGKKGDSVLDLKEAKFVKDDAGNSRVVLERYLDTFPFPYYLIVHHLDDLPNALAGLLRTWFVEVNA